MVRRCHSPKDKRYPWYGARGITVCPEWREDPVAFIYWCKSQGWMPGMEIDKDLKFPGNMVYSPDTCTLVTHRENMLGVVSRKSGRKTSKLKLSESDVADIVRRKQAGELTRLLAKDYDVTVSTINRLYRAV